MSYWDYNNRTEAREPVCTACHDQGYTLKARPPRQRLGHAGLYGQRSYDVVGQRPQRVACRECGVGGVESTRRRAACRRGVAAAQSEPLDPAWRVQEPHPYDQPTYATWTLPNRGGCYATDIGGWAAAGKSGSAGCLHAAMWAAQGALAEQDVLVEQGEPANSGALERRRRRRLRRRPKERVRV
jgi:hypothetical protein